MMTANKILKGKQVQHKGALIGIISNGGTFNIGNLQVEVIAQEGYFRILQVYEYALDVVPEKQGWVRTKKEVVKVDVPKKQSQQSLKFEHVEEVKQW